MSKIERLKVEFRDLNPQERLELVDYLMDSLDPPGLEMSEEEWNAELARRHDDIRAGRVVGIPASEVLEKLRKQYP